MSDSTLINIYGSLSSILLVLGIVFLALAVLIIVRYRLYTVVRHIGVYKKRNTRKNRTGDLSTGFEQRSSMALQHEVRVSADDETKILEGQEDETLKLSDGTDLMQKRHRNFVLTKESVYNAGQNDDKTEKASE